jgi:ubiquinone/menaquinone biosynthesis C-methylase UbiE
MQNGLKTAALQKLHSEDLLLGGGNALDLGCGAGSDAIALADIGFQVDAIDQDSEELSKLRERIEDHSINPILGNILNFDIKKNYYSIILASNSLPHIRDKEIVRSIISRMVEGLIKDGILYFSLYGQRDDASHDPLMSFFEYDEALSMISQLPLKLYYRSTEEGYRKTSVGDTKYSHIHRFTYTKI